jgi:hypothetical protein
MMTLERLNISKAVLGIIFAMLIFIPHHQTHAQVGTVLFTPVNVLYLVKDPDSPFGYKEKLQWSINSSADWERFYKTMLSLPEDKGINPDPLKAKVDDIIVLSRKDANNLTGFDIYISQKGIMSVHRDAVHTYYPDSNKLWDFLKEEQSHHASFDAFSKNIEISKKSIGIVATYNINQNIPNPVWLVDDPAKVTTYDSYFLALKPYTEFELRFSAEKIDFDDMGIFILNLNYPDAPGNIATVTQKSIRISKGAINSRFYQDTQDYYNFYKSQAREMMNYNERFGDKLKSKSEREF